MSVLNRMLQDLEARRAGGAAADSAVRATAPQPRRLLLWSLAGVAAALGLAFGDWPALFSANAARLPQPVAMVDATPAEAPARSVAPQASAVGEARPARPAAAPRAAPVRPEAKRKAAAEPGTATTLAKLSPAAVPQGPGTALPGAASASAAMAPAASAASPAVPAVAAAVPAVPGVPGHVDKQISLPSAAQRAQVLYRQGLELAASGQGRLGVQRLQEALQLDPKLRAARQQAVALLYEQGRGSEADAFAREGLALAPDDAALAYLLARGMAAQGDTAGALALLERNPRLSADAFGLRAGLHSQQGDFKRALPDYEQAVRLQPGNSLWWLGLGVALEATGQRQQARQVYARAQGIGVDSHELNVFLDQKLRALQ
jgi:MSHA biogenesis protein MshN